MSIQKRTQTRCLIEHKLHAGHRRGRKCRFLSLGPWPLIFDLQTCPREDQTHLQCKFGANPFSGSRGITYTNKKVTDNANNRTLCNSLRLVLRQQHSEVSANIFTAQYSHYFSMVNNSRAQMVIFKKHAWLFSYILFSKQLQHQQY